MKEGKHIDHRGAFPTEEIFHNGIDNSKILTGGMAMRDYFAAEALAGIISLPDAYENMDNMSIAKNCYDLADAMMEVRKGGAS